MKYDELTDKMILSNGKKFYGSGGLSVDANKEDNRFTICYGFDGGVWSNDNCSENDFTSEELIEICESQIEMWNKLKEYVKNNATKGETNDHR